jgi:hypothetical protein
MKKSLFGRKHFTCKRILAAADCIQDIRTALRGGRDSVGELTDEQTEAFESITEAMQITEIYIRDVAKDMKSWPS